MTTRRATRIRRWAAVPAVLAAGVLVLAACGDDSGSSSDTTVSTEATTTTAAVETTTTTAGSTGPQIVSFELGDVTCDSGGQGIATGSWETEGAEGVSFSVDGQAVTADAGQPTSTDDGSVGQIPCDGQDHTVTLTAGNADGQTATDSVTVSTPSDTSSTS